MVVVYVYVYVYVYDNGGGVRCEEGGRGVYSVNLLSVQNIRD